MIRLRAIGYTYDQIAEEVGVSTCTAYRHTFIVPVNDNHRNGWRAEELNELKKILDTYNPKEDKARKWDAVSSKMLLAGYNRSNNACRRKAMREYGMK